MDKPVCGTDTLGTTGAAAAPGVDARGRRGRCRPGRPGDDGRAAWKSWAAQQRFTGNAAVPDYANPEQMNRYTWYRSTGWVKPYPGDTRIYAPADVPGADIPGVDGDR